MAADALSHVFDAEPEDRSLERLRGIPLLSCTACVCEAEWTARLKEEYTVLINYIKSNKSSDSDWFSIAATDKSGIKWKGTAWTYWNSLRYEVEFFITLPSVYPAAPPEISVPSLDGRTAKMYRGGKICLSIHFEPLWARNSPRYGIAHALALGLAPWMAVEIPSLAEAGVIAPK